jgi:hypothetical protein
METRRECSANNETDASQESVVVALTVVSLEGFKNFPSVVQNKCNSDVKTWGKAMTYCA